MKLFPQNKNLITSNKSQNKKSTGNKSIIDLLPIIDYDDKSGYFKLKNGEYMDITKIVCKDCLLYTSIRILKHTRMFNSVCMRQRTFWM